MVLKSRRIVAIICLLAAVDWFAPVSSLGTQAAQSKTGKIEGTVYNVASGDPLIKARVEVVGKNVIIETGLDGTYTINLEPGTYRLRFFREGFIEQTIDGVAVAQGAAKEISAVLSPVGYGESVTVTAENTNTVAAMIEDRKAATTISDNISALEISKDTASSAAGVLQRVPGVSVVDRFVFVRGLGERYSNTSLNDAIMPTTEPDRKVVPMDLVPASLLQSVKILKTFTPDQPGEFSGGLVRMETIELPKTSTLGVSFSSGLNTRTQGKEFLSYPGGGDFFGFGVGSRKLPAGVPRNERLQRGNILLPGGFTPAELEAIGESFNNTWDARRKRARPELGLSLHGGRSFGKLGVVGALSFKNESRSQDEVRTFYQIAGPELILPFINYDYTSSTTSARTGGTLNLAYEVTPTQKLFFKNFLTNQASDETRIFQGFNGDRGTDFFNTRLRYALERIYTGQASGNHVISWLGDSLFTWRYTYSRATLDEPDLRETLYEFSPAENDFIYLNQTQSLFRLFNQMRENVREPAADWAKYWFFKGASLNTKAGFSLINRDRLFDSRRFRFVPRNTTGIDTSLRPERLLTPENIGPDGFEIREETRSTDHYVAFHNIEAGYLMADFTFKRWRFIGGARVERSKQAVETFEPFRAISVPVLASLDDTDVLPAIGVAYALKNGSMNIRAGYSKTVARPQFRELAPFEFTDVTGGRSTVGNPDLRRTLITNYDVRWEWFYSPTEIIAASFFHKDLEDPIEIFLIATTQLQTSFRNVDRARNSGLELEVRKSFGNLSPQLQHLSMNANYTYVRSRVDIGEQNRGVLTTTSRPLVGQAENTFNAILAYEVPEWNFETRALYNFTGQRITDVGAFGLPDIVEHSYPHLDLLFSKYFGGEKKWKAEVSMENLLDRQVDFRLADQPFRVYRTGRTFSFGLSYAIF
jgi:hypothetical protein